MYYIGHSHPSISLMHLVSAESNHLVKKSVEMGLSEEKGVENGWRNRKVTGLNKIKEDTDTKASMVSVDEMFSKFLVLHWPNIVQHGSEKWVWGGLRMIVAVVSNIFPPTLNLTGFRLWLAMVVRSCTQQITDHQYSRDSIE